MLKLLAAITFLSLATPCFSESIPQKTMFSQRDSLFYLNHGNNALISGNSRMALRYFNNASDFVDPSHPSSFLVDFLISFGKVVAYDNQGERTLCKESIGSLILSMQAWSGDLESSSEISSYSDSSDSSYSTEPFLELQEFLVALISMAPSEDVKALLTDLSLFFLDDLAPYFDDIKLSF